MEKSFPPGVPPSRPLVLPLFFTSEFSLRALQKQKTYIQRKTGEVSTNDNAFVPIEKRKIFSYPPLSIFLVRFCLHSGSSDAWSRINIQLRFKLRKTKRLRFYDSGRDSPVGSGGERSRNSFRLLSHRLDCERPGIPFCRFLDRCNPLPKVSTKRTPRCLFESKTRALSRDFAISGFVFGR